MTKAEHKMFLNLRNALRNAESLTSDHHNSVKLTSQADLIDELIDYAEHPLYVAIQMVIADIDE